MLKKLKQLNNKGFTIIEVLIVLAIAGLIMLIVFLAVPALQRNSRNTQRRNDVANYAAGISEWASNNPGGALPSTTPNLTDAGTGVNALVNTSVLTEPNLVTAAAATVTNAATTSTIMYVPGTICNGSNATNTGASGRQFTILWALENSSGGAAYQCQAS